METIRESSPAHLAGLDGNRFKMSNKFNRESMVIERQIVCYLRESLLATQGKDITQGAIAGISKVPVLLLELLQKDEISQLDFAMCARLAAGLGISLHEIQEGLKWPLQGPKMTNSIRLYLRRKPKALNDLDLQAFLLTNETEDFFSDKGIAVRFENRPARHQKFTLRDAIRSLLLIKKTFSDLQWFCVKDFK